MKTKTSDYDKPVAYTVDGQPLYTHPSKDGKVEAVNQFVHMSRSTDPIKPIISPETKLKHDRSAEAFPNLNLSESEYVISSVRRHPIGLLPPLSIGAFLIALSLMVLVNIEPIVKPLQATNSSIDSSSVSLIIISFIALVAVGTYIAYYVFRNNRFYLTNESVIQELQISLFSKQEQTVSLINIEDASYTQKGVIQQLFDFGSIRLSTEGDETTYRFTYVANPKEHIATLNNAVEAFKNGRPVLND